MRYYDSPVTRALLALDGAPHEDKVKALKALQKDIRDLEPYPENVHLVKALVRVKRYVQLEHRLYYAL